MDISFRLFERAKTHGLCVATALALTIVAPAHSQPVTVTLNLQSQLAGQVGSMVLTGQSFGSGVPLDPLSSDAAIAVVGQFHRATLAMDRGGTMNTICPDDQAQYADLLETDDDAQIAAAFLQPFTTRTAMLEVRFGSYTILFATLSGPTVDPLVRNYVLKSVNGLMCLTYDLRSDETYNFTVGLITTKLGG